MSFCPGRAPPAGARWVGAGDLSGLPLAFYSYILPAMADREARLGGQTHWLRKLLAEMESGD